VSVADDLIWDRPSDGPLLARLYRPAAHRPLAAVVSVHGGRWCAESRLTNAVIDTALAEAGVLVMAIDFRMPPAHRYPLPVTDINRAIRWLKSHADQYGIDPCKVGGIGTSSGGHQLLLNALLPDAPVYTGFPSGAASQMQQAGGPDASLAFVITCWAVSDPRARYRYALQQRMQLHIDSHEAYWRDEAQMDEGSPQRIVESGAATHRPPLLMIQGTADTVLTPDMAPRFAGAYAAAGADVELKMFDGVGHTFITKEPTRPESQAALRALCAFAAAAGRRAAPHDEQAAAG
jgi:acetyl esterase/lipase